MQLNNKNIEIWSRIGARATFGMVLLELEKKFPNLIVLAADTSTSAGLDRFRKNLKMIVPFFTLALGAWRLERMVLSVMQGRV